MAASSPASGGGGQLLDIAPVAHAASRSHLPPPPPHHHHHPSRPSSLGQPLSNANPSSSPPASEFQSGRKRSLPQDESQIDDHHMTKQEPGTESLGYPHTADEVHAPSPADSTGNGCQSGQRRHSDDVECIGPGAGGGGSVATANKRRKTGPGSRGVANLTPEQLAKKRANDREAQRAIRERQKAKNQEYERRIRELESQQPYQELQAALRLKDAVEAENADIKRVLASIVAMIQPLLARPSEHNQQPVYPSPNQSYGPVQATPNAPPSLNNGSTPNSAASPTSVGGPHGGQQQWQGDIPPHAGPGQGQACPQTKMLNSQRNELVHGLDMGAEKLGLGFLLDPNQRIARMQNGVHGAQESPQFRHIPMKHDWTASSVHVPGQPPSYPSNQGGTRMDYPLEPLVGGSAESSTAGGAEDWSTPIQNCAPTCPLDSLMLDFLNERRQRATEGHSPQEIVGPRYPSVSSLLDPAKSRFSHPLSRVLTDILATFPDISTLPERVAVLYIMFLLMRWQIEPTLENYLRLPDYVRPHPVQLIHPHPIWVDYIPFPAMREILINKYGESTQGQVPFENFFIPYTTTLNLNWPYEDGDVILRHPGSDELTINPVFERHMRRVENWSLGDAFHQAFPELAGLYNLKNRDIHGETMAKTGGM